MKATKPKNRKAKELSSYQANQLSGLSALPTVLLITAILVEVAVVGAVISYALTSTRFSERLSAEALAAARAGAQDAAMQAIWEGACPSLADFTVGSATVCRTCALNTPSANQVTIRSTATLFSRKKRVETILGVDPVTGEVRLQSFQEIEAGATC